MTENYREKYEELRNNYEIVVKVNGELVKEKRKLSAINAMLQESIDILHEEIEELKNELNGKRTEDSGKS